MLFRADRQYFRVERGPCFDILVAWRKQRRELETRYFDFAKSVGGVGFYAGHDDNVGNATALAAVIFDGPLPKGWKLRQWSSFVVEDGKTPGWPDQRTKIGKDALAAIKAMPLRPSSYHVCGALGVPTSLEYSGKGTIKGYDCMGVFETANIGWTGDSFYIALPKIAEARQRLTDQGYTVATPEWQPLDGMEPILKEEMELDFARAKLREKEAA